MLSAAWHVYTLSDEEIRSIFNALNPTNPGDSRNQTILMMLLDTRLRITELINLKIRVIHINEDFLKVTGKARRSALCLSVIMLKELYKGIFSGIGLHQLMFARLTKGTTVQRLHAHLCRHTFATRFLINGGDVFTPQQILGHSTLEMVRHYVNLASKVFAIRPS